MAVSDRCYLYLRASECRRARDAKRDIPVPLSPCARATTCTCRGRPAPGPRLRHFAPPPDPYDEWLDGVSDALASGLRQLRDLRPLRHFGQPLAPTPTADYPPRASRFPGGQRVYYPCPGQPLVSTEMIIREPCHPCVASCDGEWIRFRVGTELIPGRREEPVRTYHYPNRSRKAPENCL